LRTDGEEALIHYPQSIPGFFENLQPIPGAIDAVNVLRSSEQFDVYVAARRGGLLPQKRGGRPLKYVSQLLGHKSIDSTEIYTNVLTIDGGHFLEGVDFH
jgi:hypothetical protein